MLYYRNRDRSINILMSMTLTQGTVAERSFKQNNLTQSQNKFLQTKRCSLPQFPVECGQSVMQANTADQYINLK